MFSCACALHIVMPPAILVFEQTPDNLVLENAIFMNLKNRFSKLQYKKKF
jgi:hypothetical protein